LFLPFIDLLRERTTAVRIDARTDFRREKLADAPVWHVPAAAAADAAMDQAWRRLTGGDRGAAHEVISKGRVIHVPRAARGVARFSFADLCERPLGALDYLKLAREFHTLLIDHIPVMDFPRRNEAKRFITLIDTLYDQAVKLVASAEAEPDALYRASDGFEAIEFKRTASRLFEMRSDSYLSLPHGRRDSPGQLQEGIVET
jgi:cell division protein ZapE